MNKGDKDRYLKQLAIRACLAAGHVPCPEVVVYSPSDLTKEPEPLTDLDVVGLEPLDDGGMRRTLFDCKSGKMSAINRALWASGLTSFTGIESAIILLKVRPLENHRLAALKMCVDLHSEETFSDLIALSSPGFNKDIFYQSTADRWQQQQEAYTSWPWSKNLFECSRHLIPISGDPAKTFRRLISELRAVRGEIDPAKPAHRAIFFDLICGMLILWSSIAKEVRRIYRSDSKPEEFVQMLRYYIWGGQESFSIRQEIGKKFESENADLPEWGRLQKFVSHALAEPKHLLTSALVARELSIREVTDQLPELDKNISEILKREPRVSQFIISSSDYLVHSSRAPLDLQKMISQSIGELI
ncbi:hypothetical protein [Erythrobacter sp. BLCC-B19]|uniref:hypothetical protein n=1 Tax=Erythrobacter sp. BLCC-B19 TaxID=3025315 RepID=UPI00235DDA99|nr:hypothetical protein [Erythrobacter sp. BLCC-B19]WDA40460.1 hypothetical protein PS060_12930 [Erythrobacter sp. BLCC-B19]